MRDLPERKAIRLPGYDYASAGTYFVTICVQNRRCLFGDVVDGVMEPTVAGLMVESWWSQVSSKFPSVALDAFVVMPNHLHGIVMLGARVPDDADAPWDPDGHIGPPLHRERPHVGADLRVRPPSPTASPRNPSLATVVQWFKTMTTNDYIRGVRDFGFPPFDRRLWQRNYYEHIIRDGTLDTIRAYIEGNPARWTDDDLNPT